MENILIHTIDKHNSLIKEVLQILFNDPILSQSIITEIEAVLKKKDLQNNSFQKYEQSWIISLIFITSESHEKLVQKTLKQKNYQYSLWSEFKKLPLKYQFIFILKTQFDFNDKILSESLSLSIESIPLIYNQALKILTEKRSSIFSKFDSSEELITAKQLLMEIKESKMSEVESETLPKKNARKTPWYIKTGLEGGFIGILIISGIALIPNILLLYEKNLDRKLETFEYLQVQSNSTNIEPAIEDKAVETIDKQPVETIENEVASTSPTFKKFKILPHQFIRFVIASSSTEDMRKIVGSILESLSPIENETPLDGLEVPGGIQFKVLLSAQATESFKEQLEKILTEDTLSPVNRNNNNPPINWYINPSRRRLPKGAVEVVIFITQA